MSVCGNSTGIFLSIIPIRNIIRLIGLFSLLYSFVIFPSRLCHAVKHFKFVLAKADSLSVVMAYINVLYLLVFLEKLRPLAKTDIRCLKHPLPVPVIQLVNSLKVRLRVLFSSFRQPCQFVDSVKTKQTCQ
jgi:hypothetical protein